MMVEALKSFRADGTDLSRHDIVDGSGWPNLAKLIAMRYVRPAEEAQDDSDIAFAKATAREAAPSTIKTAVAKSRKGRKRKGS